MRRKIPSLQALACFDAAARQQSYTRAAQELALTQGAVSRQISALEGFVGVALFRRTRHGVLLTDAGRDYAAQVASRLAALERDTLDLMSQQGRSQVLHLAAFPTFATRWLIPRLPSLVQRHPGLTLHLDTRTRPFLFADTPFDGALVAASPEQLSQWPGTRALRLLDEDVWPVCAPALLAGQRCLTAQDIATQVLLQQSTRPDAWRQWFQAQGADAAQAWAGPRLELFSMTAAAAVSGLGVALLPRLLIEQELADGSLVLASEQPLPTQRAYYLVSPERSLDPAAWPLLSRWLQEQCLSGDSGEE